MAETTDRPYIVLAPINLFTLSSEWHVQSVAHPQSDSSSKGLNQKSNFYGAVLLYTPSYSLSENNKLVINLNSEGVLAWNSVKA